MLLGKWWMNWRMCALAGRGDTARVAEMVEHGVDVNARGLWGRTMLHSACVAGHAEMCRLLLDQGADIGAAEAGGLTPLFCAVRQGHLEITKLLIEAGADVNARDKGGATPLHYAITRKQGELAQALIYSGADVNASNQHGIAPLHVAVDSCEPSLVSMLLANAADVNARNLDDLTALHRAANWGGPSAREIANMLLHAGADLHARTRVDENTPLHVAAIMDNPSMVRLLLGWGAYRDSRNRRSYTPAQEAATRGSTGALHELSDRRQ